MLIEGKPIHLWAEEHSPAVTFYIDLCSQYRNGQNPAKGTKDRKTDRELCEYLLPTLNYTRQPDGPIEEIVGSVDLDTVIGAFEGLPVKQVWSLTNWLLTSKQTTWARYMWLRDKLHERRMGN